MKRTLALMLGVLPLAAPLYANDEIPQKIQVTKTEHADLPAGGTLHLKNSTGELTVQGWDQSGIEITTIKSTKFAYKTAEPDRAKASQHLDAVKVTVARQAEELVVTTDFPRNRRYLPRPSVGYRDFDLEYVIKVPRGANIIVDHDEGELHFDDVTGDIHATTNQGTITLRLPQAAQYTIDAKSRIGDVDSDIAGTTTRRHFGHEFVQAATAPHKLYLRNGFGDIIILRMHQPVPR